jgi:hypothetical protein
VALVNRNGAADRLSGPGDGQQRHLADAAFQGHWALVGNLPLTADPSAGVKSLLPLRPAASFAAARQPLAASGSWGQENRA